MYNTSVLSLFLFSFYLKCCSSITRDDCFMCHSFSLFHFINMFIVTVVMYEWKKSNSIEDIQLSQENSNKNKTKFLKGLLKKIREKITFAQRKANDIVTSVNFSIWLSSLQLTTGRFSPTKREFFD